MKMPGSTSRDAFSPIFDALRVAMPGLRFEILEIGALPLGSKVEPFHRLLDEFPGSRIHAFEIDDFFRQMLLLGMDEVELTRSLLDRVVAFEQTYFARHPWALPAP